MVLAALTGCAGAEVSDVASASAAGSPPTEILVDVNTATTNGDVLAQPADALAAKLRSDLVQRLTKAGLPAEPFVPGTNYRAGAVLHVSITDAEPGSYLERFIIGFGLGRSELQAKVDLASTDGTDHVITAFNTSSATGRFMPGLILPGAVAAATRNVVPLVVGGGVKLATSLRGGLDSSVQQTATAIVGQLRRYYASVGWRWPDDGSA
ncbi:MAG TPA: DUF4410 domain-containing protein [Acetobacteraceae bacterium]|nr:DUF4410 domain-containing protein [Acetobacteraceae bacterium]